MFQLNKTYIIRISAGANVLTYTAEVLSIDEHFIKIKDNHGKESNINLSAIIYYDKVQQ